MEIKLRLPLEHVFVTQPWGYNFVDFYKKLGLLGHNGIDFRARDGCPCYAAHDGNIVWVGKDGGGGIGIEILGDGFKTLYYHLKKVEVKANDKVKAGDLIGYCDNTGIYTTGDHLHFGLKEVDSAGNTLNYGNGYNGAIDPSPYFAYNWAGYEMKPTDYDKSRCYHRYYRGRPKGGYQNELKILAILGRKGIWPTVEKINALVYGGWDLETVLNPSMFEIYSQLKKSEFKKGYKPFNNNL